MCNCFHRSPATSRSTWTGPFRSFTFLEMWHWYSLHKTLQDDLQAGTDHERKMAQVAYCSVRQWLLMKEDVVTTNFRVPLVKIIVQHLIQTSRLKFTCTSQKPPQDGAPPAAAASFCSSGSEGDGNLADDALLVEALTSFERQGISV